MYRTLAAVAVVGLGTTAGADTEIALEGVRDINELSLDKLLDQPVIAVSRVAQRPTESPTLVSVVDSDMVSALGLRTAGELLRTLRGGFLSDDRNYTYFGLRGFNVPGDYGTRLAFSIDGHVINDPVFQQSPIGYELGLPFGAISRVELVSGAASSVYGSSSLLGAAQVVTHTGATRPGLHASMGADVTAGSPNGTGRSAVAPFNQQVDASYGRPGAIDVFVAASFVQRPGLSAIDAPELAGRNELCVDRTLARAPCTGVLRAPDNEEAGGLFASVKTRTLAIRALLGARIKRIPTAPFDTTIGDPSVDSLDARAYVDVQHTSRFDSVEIMTRGAIDHYHYEGTYAYDTGEAPYAETRSVMKDGTTPTWVTGEVRGRVRKPRNGKALSNLDLVMGTELAAVIAAPQFATADGEDYFRRTDRELASAAYAQVDGRVARVLVLSTGARLDYRPSSAGLTMNPRVGAMLDGGDRGRLRASYGTAFREPNLYERYYASGTPGSGAAHLATPNLGRENASSFELSAERFLGPNLRVLAVGYVQRLENLMVLQSSEVGDVMFANQDKALGKGVELELEAKWHATILRVVASAQRSQDGQGNELVNSPRSLASATLIAPVGRARLGVESYMVGSRRTVGGDTLDPAFVTNATLTAPHAMGNLDLSLGVRNLFDERWADPGSPDHRQSRITRDPRTLWLRIGASF